MEITPKTDRADFPPQRAEELHRAVQRQQSTCVQENARPRRKDL